MLSRFFGVALAAGSTRVPRPATGMTAFLTGFIEGLLARGVTADHRPDREPLRRRGVRTGEEEFRHGRRRSALSRASVPDPSGLVERPARLAGGRRGARRLHLGVDRRAVAACVQRQRPGVDGRGVRRRARRQPPQLQRAELEHVGDQRRRERRFGRGHERRRVERRPGSRRDRTPTAGAASPTAARAWGRRRRRRRRERQPDRIDRRRARVDHRRRPDPRHHGRVTGGQTGALGANGSNAGAVGAGSTGSSGTGTGGAGAGAAGAGAGGAGAGGAGAGGAGGGR